MSISDIARHLVKPAGSGDETDADLVRIELDLLPAAELEMLRASGVRVLACHGSVVDHRPDMADETPRGWPAGSTWKLVPGAYLPDDNAVAIATLPDPATGRRRIPPKGVMHSAWNLVLHETMHADDYLEGQLRSHNPEFLAARTADLAALDPYEQQEGAAGYEETYAESAARAFGLDPRFPAAWPNLSRFWADRQMPIRPGRADRAIATGAEPVGTAEIEESGAIRLDLRAQSASGAIGHALVSLQPGDPLHADVARQLLARRQRAASPRGVLLISPFPERGTH